MRYALILLLTGLCYSTVQAQTQTDSTSTQTDSTQTEKQKAVTFTLGAQYTNNASYYGQAAANKLPYIAAVASVQLRSGFYFTGTAIRLLNDSNHVVSASAAGAGFTFPIGKKLVADLSYSHTFYPAYSAFLQAANPDNAAASLKYKYWMTTGINVDYAFGKQQDIFATFSTEKQIQLGSIAKNKDLITLTPAISVVAGTQHFYETYVREKRLKDSLLGLPIPIIPGVPGTTETVTAEATRFDLLSYNLKVPLAYNRAHYMVEVEYQLSLLSDKALSGAGTTNSFVTCSFYYQF
ncbi:hypothetical protein [Chitinophaga vietnamensis]|uniref:hypothetical protein n=1 Tax=Chitinophaga vietnamensis TaxID=2593957 RepID=UPI0011783C23|nr:hypothetical protein [Chitinophaga vietnamensis]